MADPTADFFTELARRGHDRLLEDFVGTVRFDLVAARRTDYWFLTISNGDVSVSREDRVADCVVRADRAVFDRLMTGEANAWSLWLSNHIVVSGPLILFRALSQSFPGPRGARHPRSLAPRRGRQA
jgi:predicted lipid carrier protein YhbT